MNKEEIRSISLELRIMMGMMAKTTMMAFQQRMSQTGHEISGLQFGVLRALETEGQHTLGNLSKKFMVDPSTLVPTIDALEKKNLVVRNRDAKDRRRVQIGLTEQGSEVASAFNVVSDDDPLYQSLLNLGSTNIVVFMNLMREVLKHMPEGEKMLENVQDRLRMSKFSPPNC